MAVKRVFGSRFFTLFIRRVAPLIAMMRNAPVLPGIAATIRIGTFSRSVALAPYLIAREKKWFEEAAQKQNAKVEYAEFQSLAAINEAFAADKIDVVFEAEIPAIAGKAAGIDVKIKGVSADETQGILVPKNSTIQNMRDLKGKKIAVLAGTGSHYLLLKILKKNGLTARDAEILDMSLLEAKAAFESGKVDVWSVWPPFPEHEEIAGKGRILDLQGEDLFVQVIIAVRGGFARRRPRLLEDFLQVIRKTQNWTAANPEESQSIVAQGIGLDREVVKKAWLRHNFQPVIKEKEIADIQAKADFLYDQKFIKNKVDVAKSLVDL